MDPEEYEWALRARQGDGEALSHLVARVRVRLFALAFAELRHYADAQDAVAEALLRICRHVHQLKDPEQVRPWMNRIVSNEARRILKSRKSETVGDDAPIAAPNVFPSPLRLDIERALKRLPEDHAHAVALFYLAGLPIREIARRVNRPEGTVKFWLHQGRQQLAQPLKEHAPTMMTPQTERWTVSIVSTEINPDLISQMAAALKTAGWETVNVVRDFEAAGRLEPAGAGEGREFHLPAPLAGSRCIILDEWIGGRSAFELLPLLSATRERKEAAILLLVNAAAPERPVPSNITVQAAYAAGVDMLLTKPFDIVEFANFGRQIRAMLAQKPDDPAENS